LEPSERPVIVPRGWWSTTLRTDGVLALWAEDSTASAVPTRRRGRRPKVVDHPFAVPSEEVAKVLDLTSLATGDFEPDHAVLAMPTVGPGPADSPELLLARPSPADGMPSDTSWAHWRVPVVVLDADAALSLLVQGNGSVAPGNDTQGTDASTIGADLRALRALAMFAVDLTSRGQVLPSVRAVGPGRAAAVWRPLVTGADAAWLRATVAGLPAVAGSEVPDAGRTSSRAEQAVAAVDALVDAAVRAALGGTRASRRPVRSVAAAWRAALVGPAREFAVEPAQSTALEAALAQWQDEAVHGGAVRACFRLVEPPEPSDREQVTATVDAVPEPAGSAS
jgi:non-specific serine/threonine protein kinase